MNDFARQLEALIPRLRRYARALTRDVSRADDVVQSCLTRALAKQHLWQPGSDLRAWLFTILHNQYVNEVRSSVRDGINVARSEEHTSELQSLAYLVCRLLLEKKKKNKSHIPTQKQKNKKQKKQ